MTNTDSQNVEEQNLDIRVLGTFSVSVNKRRVNDSSWKLRKAKAIVKLLAISPKHRLPRDVVSGCFVARA